MLGWLLALTPARAGCTFQATIPDLERAVAAAEAAYVSLDVEEFERASSELDFVLPCVVEPLDPRHSARLHRLRGLGRFVDGDTDGARAALLGAKALEPAYVFPEEVLPTGYELRTLYEELASPEPGGVRLPRPRGGALVLDGTEGRYRPQGRPVVFQRLDGPVVVDTRYLGPDDHVPPYPGARKRQTTLLVTGVSTAVLGGAAYGLAWASRTSLSEAADLDRLEAGAARTNALTGAGIGLVVAGAVQVGVGLAWRGP